MLVHEGEINMDNIGCDIGKNNLDVYLNGKLRKYPNNKNRNIFVKQLQMILETSEEYEKRLLTVLHDKNILLL